MLKLAHLYRIIISALLICNISKADNIQEKPYQLIKENRILFKIISDVYSLVELQNYSKVIQKFSCMFENSVIIESFSFSKQKLRKLAKISLSNSLEAENILIYNLLKRFIKILKYLETQSIQVAPELYDALKHSSKVNKCSRNGEFIIDGDLKEIIKAEVYFRSRFRDKSFWVSDTELKKAMELNSRRSRKNVRATEERKKKNKAISLFIDSVEKQVAHENFY